MTSICAPISFEVVFSVFVPSMSKNPQPLLKEHFETLKTEIFLAMIFPLVLIFTDLLSCLLHPRDLHSIF
jgi:hypothetical protein